MNAINKGNLPQLASMNGEYVVSIYMPATIGAEQRQNPVHFKSLVRTATKQMQSRGIGEPAIQKMTVSARTLLDRDDIWQKLAQGLAVFVSRDALHALQLPFRSQEICTVGKYAYLMPLLAWDSSDASYFVLAVSQKAVRLLRGSRAGLEEVALPVLPKDMASALHYDVRQGTLQMHSGQPQLVGKEGVVFHGQGGEVDVAKIELVEFFRQIDRVLCEYLQLHGEPLLFAGVDYLFPIYQSVNSYPQLAERALAGNPELLSPQELSDRAWPLVETQLRERELVHVSQEWNAAGRDRATHRLVEILSAAGSGAIETLYVAAGARRMGRYLPEAAAVRYDAAQQADSEELVNEAAVLVLRTGGRVTLLDRNHVPEGDEMAAILRYPYRPTAAPQAASYHIAGQGH